MRGQDIAKAILLAIGILGVIATSFGVRGIATLLQTK